MITARFEPGELAPAWAAAMDELARRDVVGRLWAGDHTVIQEDPSECANRVGWMRAAASSEVAWPRWALLADVIVDGASDRAAGSVTDVVVLGTGGPHRFAEVLAATFDAGEGFPAMRILDSTHPAAVARVAAECDPDRTVVVVAAKSGTDIATRSHLELFWERSPIGARFVAITDPGSALEALATERDFRAVLHDDPEIGGRFAALSALGMVPAALLGLEGPDLLDAADEASAVLGPETPVQDHLGCQLGALMAVAAAAGRDKLTLHLDEHFEALGPWLEQLIAGSTGTHGRGVLPVLGEGVDAPDPAGRLHVLIGDTGIAPASIDGPWVHLQVEEPADLAAQVVLWEWVATIAGVVLGVNPFDEPEVGPAELAARQLLGRDEPDGPGLPEPATGTLDEALGLLRPGDALVICAFVDPAEEERFNSARVALGRRAGVATTLGIGPRFLHSTGQLHKGGADRHVVVQTLDVPQVDLDIPGTSSTFGQLLRAQADGDLVALRAARRRVVRVAPAELLAAAD